MLEVTDINLHTKLSDFTCIKRKLMLLLIQYFHNIKRVSSSC